MSLTGNAENSYVLKGKITSIPSVDKSLTKEGYPADAKTVGDAIKALQDGVGSSGGSQIYSHIESITNPHKVTARQVGLGEVDNTSDMNKPVSTAQAEAIADAKQAGLDAQAGVENAMTEIGKTNSNMEQSFEYNSTLMSYKVSKSGDTMLGALTVVEPTEDGHAVPKSYVDGKHKEFTATLWQSDWSSASVGYMQTVTVDGLLPTDKPFIDIDGTGKTAEEVAAMDESWTPYKAETAINSLTVWVYKRPDPDITIKLKVVR